MRELSTATEVIDALGGTLAAAQKFSRPMQAVTNWRARDRLPSELFLLMTQALAEIGCCAPPSLWGIAQAEQVA